MKNKDQIVYILIGVLLGIVVILAGVLYISSGKIHQMELQVASMEKTMEETLAEVQSGESTGEQEQTDDVEAEYVDVDGKEDTAQTDKKKKKEPTPTPESEEVDARTEFNDLQPQLETMIQEFEGQVDGKWAVYVEDLDSGGNMTINDDKMKAASLIKLYIMGAVYEQYDKLSKDNSNLDSLLNKMITVSDNDAANKLVNLLGSGNDKAGMLAVNAFCTKYNFSSTQMGRLLLEQNPVGENYTSVKDCGKFLYYVYGGQKFDHAEDMLNLLKAQTLRSKIPSGIPEGVEVANKTGELDDVQNDVAIVYGEDVPYIVCIMAEGVSGTDGPVNAISTMSASIYGYTNQT